MDILLNKSNHCDEISMEDGEIDDEDVIEVVETVKDMDAKVSDLKDITNPSEPDVDGLAVKSKKSKHKKSSNKKRKLNADDKSNPDDLKKLKTNDFKDKDPLIFNSLSDENDDNILDNNVPLNENNYNLKNINPNEMLESQVFNKVCMSPVKGHAKENSSSSCDNKCLKNGGNIEDVSILISQIRNEVAEKDNVSDCNSSDCVITSEYNTNRGKKNGGEKTKKNHKKRSKRHSSRHADKSGHEDKFRRNDHSNSSRYDEKRGKYKKHIDSRRRESSITFDRSNNPNSDYSSYKSNYKDRRDECQSSYKSKYDEECKRSDNKHADYHHKNSKSNASGDDYNGGHNDLNSKYSVDRHSDYSKNRKYKENCEPRSISRDRNSFKEDEYFGRKSRSYKNYDKRCDSHISSNDKDMNSDNTRNGSSGCKRNGSLASESCNRLYSHSNKNIHKNEYDVINSDKISSESKNHDVEKHSWNYNSDDEGLLNKDSKLHNESCVLNEQKKVDHSKFIGNINLNDSRKAVTQSNISDWRIVSKRSPDNQNDFNKKHMTCRRDLDEGKCNSEYKNDLKKTSHITNQFNDEVVEKSTWGYDSDEDNATNTSFKIIANKHDLSSHTASHNISYNQNNGFKDSKIESSQSAFGNSRNQSKTSRSSENREDSICKPNSDKCYQSHDEVVEKSTWAYDSDDDNAALKGNANEHALSNHTKSSSNSYNQNNSFRHSKKEQSQCAFDNTRNQFKTSTSRENREDSNCKQNLNTCYQSNDEVVGKSTWGYDSDGDNATNMVPKINGKEYTPPSNTATYSNYNNSNNGFKDCEREQTQSSYANRHNQTKISTYVENNLNIRPFENRKDNDCKPNLVISNQPSNVVVEKSTWDYDSDGDNDTNIALESNSNQYALSNFTTMSNNCNNSNNGFTDCKGQQTDTNYGNSRNQSHTSTLEKNPLHHNQFENREDSNYKSNSYINIKTNDEVVEKSAWDYDSDGDISINSATKSNSNADALSSHNTTYNSYTNHLDSFKDSKIEQANSSYGNWGNRPKTTTSMQTSFNNKPCENREDNDCKFNSDINNQSNDEVVEKSTWCYDSDGENDTNTASKSKINEHVPSIHISTSNNSFNDFKREQTHVSRGNWRSQSNTSISEQSSFDNKLRENREGNDFKPNSDISNPPNDEVIEKSTWCYDSDGENDTNTASKSNIKEHVPSYNSFNDFKREQTHGSRGNWRNTSISEQGSFNNKPRENRESNDFKPNSDINNQHNDEVVEKSAWGYDSDGENDTNTASKSKDNAYASFSHSATSNNYNNQNDNSINSKRQTNQGGYSNWRNNSKTAQCEQNSFNKNSRNDNNEDDQYKNKWKDMPESNYQSNNVDTRKKQWNLASGDEGFSISKGHSNSYTPSSYREYTAKQNDFNNRNGSFNDSQGEQNSFGKRSYGGYIRKPCVYFQKGSCRMADNCKFLHESPKTAQVNEPQIEELCPSYEHQDCFTRNTCVYMHNEFPCKLFHVKSKICPSGDNCKYSHVELTPKMKFLLEKHLGEKIDSRNDRSGSGSVLDHTEHRPHSNTPCNDDIMSDPYFQNPMQGHGQPWTPQIDIMHRYMTQAGFPGMMPNIGSQFGVAPLMPVYNSKVDTMKELDSLAQMVVSKDMTNKKPKSPLKVNNQELTPGAYTPNMSASVHPSVRLPGLGGYAAYSNDPVMMDFINMAAYGYYPPVVATAVNVYDKPWKPFILQVPVKIPYPLMNINTDELHHKHADPRLRGHPSVRTENNASLEYTIDGDQKATSPLINIAIDNIDRHFSSSISSLAVDIVTVQQSPVYPVSEETITFLASDSGTPRTSDRSYLLDSRFKRKKISARTLRESAEDI